MTCRGPCEDLGFAGHEAVVDAALSHHDRLAHFYVPAESGSVSMNGYR